MAQSDPPAVHVFDVAKIRELVELMEGYDLSLVELEAGRQRIRLRRGFPPAAVAPAPMMAPSWPAPPAGPPAPHAPAAGDAPARPASAPGAAESSNLVPITSLMVGTFYGRPNPKAEPYVKVGSRVNPETMVCLIEAMKTYTDHPAGVSGVIAAILVKDGEAVEFGQPLFQVDPSK